MTQIMCYYDFLHISGQPFEWPEADSVEAVFYNSWRPGESKIFQLLFQSLAAHHYFLCIFVDHYWIWELLLYKVKLKARHLFVYDLCFGIISYPTNHYLETWQYLREEGCCSYLYSHSHHRINRGFWALYLIFIWLGCGFGPMCG